MRVLTGKEMKTFEQIVGLSQPALKTVMRKYLVRKYGIENVKETGDYIIAFGDIPIALVAHMDTVFKQPASEIFYDTRKNVIWSPTGLGADDRAGVFAMVQIIKSGLRPHIILTTDEEIGGIGATMLGKEECPFEDLRYLIELDRRGENDCVFYDCANEEFIDYVETFGFKESFGSFSDISMIAPEWEVAAVNLSIGYRDEHTTSEVLFVSHMFNTIDKVKKMLSEDIEKVRKYNYIPSAYSFNWLNSLKTDYKKHYACWGCGTYCEREDLFPVKALDGNIDLYCLECATKGNIEWCAICGEPFEVDPADPDAKICKDCYEEAFRN